MISERGYAKKLIATFLHLCISVTPIQSVFASEMPIVTKFEFSPKEIELTGESTEVSFELVAQHPLGIENTSTILTLKGPRNNSISTYLNRINRIGVFDNSPVIFKGSIQLPRNISEGSYSISVKELKNFNSKGYQYSTGEISPSNFRELVGAENSLLVRLNGYANISQNMFSGPTYDTLSALTFKDSSKYNRQRTPILRVGEQYDPNDYFEKYVPSVPLSISTSTPSVCIVEESIMKFLTKGTCQFKVFTKKTKDYAEQSIENSVTIDESRKKSTFIVGEIASQKISDLPIILSLPSVFSAAVGYVLPTSITPSICISTGFSVRITSGGTCTLTYQTKETTEYLASEVYKQNIEIPRNPQTILFALPTTAPITSKKLTLTATASSGGSVVFSTTSPEVCKAEGNLLTLLKSGPCIVTASQAGTTTISPISISQTITIVGNKQKRASTICVRKGKQVEVTKAICPRGYKKLKP